jgi:hypothetical protein
MGFAGGKESGHLVVSFLLGAAMPTFFLFFHASDRLGEGLSRFSIIWGNGAMPPPVSPAPPEAYTRDHDEVRVT